MITILRDNAPVIADVVLDHWAAVYAATPWMSERGVLFETFLRHPHELLAIGLDMPMPVQMRTGAQWRETAVPVPTSRHQVENLERAVDALMRERRVHVSGGRCIETVSARHKHRRQPGDHHPWRLGAAR